jgi:hypothetical protein
MSWVPKEIAHGILKSEVKVLFVKNSKIEIKNYHYFFLLLKSSF